MSQDPDEIREDIEETRDRLGDRAEALGYKTDVSARVSDKVTETKDKVVNTLTPNTERARRGKRVAEENPFGLAIAGLGLGLLVGALLPSTDIEDKRLGEVSDQITDQAKDVGQEAMERGKTIVGEAAEAAKEQTQQEGRDMAESLRERTAEGTTTETT